MTTATTNKRPIPARPAVRPVKTRPQSKRIVFSFDRRSLEGLERVKERFGVNSLAEAVRLSLQLADSLQSQAVQGYDEVVVRNKDKDQQRVMAGLSLVSGASDE